MIFRHPSFGKSVVACVNNGQLLIICRLDSSKYCGTKFNPTKPIERPLKQGAIC